MNITLNLAPETGLEQALKNAGIDNPASVTKLAVNGRLYRRDFRYICENMAETLQEIDMSGALLENNILTGHAFENCSALNSVIFPDSLIGINERAFFNCNSLTSVTIPASTVDLEITDIIVEIWAFSGCPNLRAINVHPDNPVYSSEDGILYNREKTELIVIPRGWQGDYVIPPSVVEIGWYAFQECKGLTSIMLNHDLPCHTSEDGVLFNKDKTEVRVYPEGRRGEYVVPDSVVEFHLHAFSSCIGLTSIFIPASVVDMGTSANDIFEKSISYVSEDGEKFWSEENIIEKEERAFRCCSALTSIIAHPDHPLYASEDGVLFSKDKTELLFYPKGRQGDYVIPSSVVKIGNCAFLECTGLTSVTFPESVTHVGREAFHDCTGLKSISIPDSMTFFPSFEGCTALTSVSIPNLVTEIDAITFDKCTGLTSVIISASVERIGGFAFRGCTGLTSVLIPDSVVRIERYAFGGCTGLTSITIPAATVEISEGAFENCSACFTVHPDNPVYYSDGSRQTLKVKNACGKAGNLDWNLTDGVLTISGDGAIPDNNDLHYEFSGKKRLPWYHFRNSVKSLVFKGNISNRSIDTFSKYKNLSSVTFEEFTVPYFKDNSLKINDIINRVFQGYTDSDVWNIDNWFATLMPRMLQEYKRKTYYRPRGMSHEERDEILDRMIFCFSEMPRKTDNETNKQKAHREKMKKEGFALFCKYFEQLHY